MACLFQSFINRMLLAVEFRHFIVYLITILIFIQIFFLLFIAFYF